MSGPLAAMTPRADASDVLARGPAEVLPVPSFLEAVKANWRLSDDDSQAGSYGNKVAAYNQLEDALVATGQPRSRYRDPSWGSYFQPVETAPQRFTRLWGDVAAARLADPRAFADVPAKNQAEFEQWAARRQGKRDADIKTAGMGGFGTAIVPGISYGLAHAAEPENLAQLPLGAGGTSVAGVILRQFGAGVIGTALRTPETVAARAAMGESYTGGDLARDLALGGAGNAAFVGTHIAVGKLGEVTAGALAPVAQRIGSALTVSDDIRYANALKNAVPPEVRPPDVQAALHVIGRAEEVHASSPYTDTHDGLAAHADQLQAAIDRVQGEQAAAAATAPAAPIANAGTAAPAGHFDSEATLKLILRLEGGAQVTSDSGGLTKYGISQKAHPGVDIANLSEAQALAIYRRDYLGALDLSGRDPATAAIAVDAAVNHGPAFARKLLDEAGGDPARMLALRRAEYARLIATDPAKYGRYAHEWEARLEQLGRAVGTDGSGSIETAVAGLDDSAVAVPPDPALAAAPVEAPAVPELDPAKLHEGLVSTVRTLAGDGSRSLNQVGALADEIGVSEQQLRAALDTLAGQGELVKTSGGLYRRPAAPGSRGPDDMIRFAAKAGGLSYDGLGADAAGSSKGHDLKNTTNLDHFVPGVGPLLRPTGIGLDAMGERLWDAGYFGPPSVTPRPSETELITAFDDAIRTGAKRYSFFDTAPPEKAPAIRGEPAPRAGVPKGWDPEHYAYERLQWTRAAERLLGRDLTPDEFAAAHAISLEGLGAMAGPEDGLSETEWEAGVRHEPFIRAMVNRELDAALEDAYLESEKELYDATEHQFRTAAGGEAAPADGSGQGPGADAGDAGAGRGGGEARNGDARPDQLSPADSDELAAAGLAPPAGDDPKLLAQFDDPAGPGVVAAADSAWHDLRQGEDPAIAARQAQEAKLGAAAPLRGENKTGAAQDGTLGLPMFDAADQPKFDLGDGKGARPVAEIAAELDAEGQGLDAIKGCLK